MNLGVLVIGYWIAFVTSAECPSLTSQSSWDAIAGQSCVMTIASSVSSDCTTDLRGCTVTLSATWSISGLSTVSLSNFIVQGGQVAAFKVTLGLGSFSLTNVFFRNFRILGSDSVVSGMNQITLDTCYFQNISTAGNGAAVSATTLLSVNNSVFSNCR